MWINTCDYLLMKTDEHIDIDMIAATTIYSLQCKNGFLKETISETAMQF